MFDKSLESYPFKKEMIFLNSCGVSPLHSTAVRASADFNHLHARRGNLLFTDRPDPIQRFHGHVAGLLKTKPENISYVESTATGINLIANGFPFKPGDEIISYVHEYPSNHYPWRLQGFRGATLKLLSDVDSGGVPPAPGRPRAWSFEELERAITPKTRVVALSHVQFTSGFTADLERLGKLCWGHGIELVIDAAQSLGALPIEPEAWNISAVVASGWKWLCGPLGAGILYTSEAFRARLRDTMVGPYLMKQGTDYLDHRWMPVSDGGRFEYSTVPYGPLVGLDAVVNEIFLKHSSTDIRTEIFRLQDLFLAGLDKALYKPVIFPPENRSGILSIVTTKDPEEIVKKLDARGIVCTSRGGYLRIAPQFYVSDEEVEHAIAALNDIA